MYGQILGASTVVTGVSGVAFLPNTGNTKLLFKIALFMLSVGIVTLTISTILSLKQRSNKA